MVQAAFELIAQLFILRLMTYWFSKLLPLALLPLGLALLLLLVGLIGRWRWPVITAILLLWVCSLGVVSQMLWRWLEAPWQRKAVDLD